MVESKATYSGPFEARTAFVVLPVLALLGLLVALPLCSNAVALSVPEKELVLGIFITALACGWFAFTGTETKTGFVGMFFLSLMIANLLIAMAHTDSDFPFWIALVLMVFTTVVDTLGGENDRWENLLTSLYVIWVVVSVVVTLGSEDFFQYAKPTSRLSDIHPLLELRSLLSVLFFALSLIHAVRTAFLDDKPKIPELPSYTLPDVSGEMHPILRPVFQALQVVLNLLFLVIITVTNIAWTLLATVAAYLIRTGQNLAFRFYQSLSDGIIWKSIAQTLLTFALIFLFARGILPALPKLIHPYLTEDLPFYSKTWETLVVLIKIGGMALLVLFCIAFIWALWQNRKGVLEIANQGLFGLAMMVFAFALSGAGMYGMARIEFFAIKGFHSVGLFLFLSIVFVVLGGAIIFKLAFQDRKNNASQNGEEGGYYQKENSPDEDQASRAQIKNNWVGTAFAALLFIGLAAAFGFFYSPSTNTETKGSRVKTGKIDSVSTTNKDTLVQKTPPARQDTVASTKKKNNEALGFSSTQSELESESGDEPLVSPPSSAPKFQLRSKGATLSEDDAKAMLANQDFYTFDWKPNGKGIVNQYDLRISAGEQVVLDQATGLMWQYSGSPSYMSYVDAENYIHELNNQRFAGYSGWRLPTLEEAMSLMEPVMKNGSLYIDPVFDEEQWWIWTMDKQNVRSAAWVVDFNKGRYKHNAYDEGNYVRAVR